MCKFFVGDIAVYLYRPPSRPPEPISEIVAVVRAAGKNTLLLGDFNIPEIDWTGDLEQGREQNC
jgi:hypothetical protein